VFFWGLIIKNASGKRIFPLNEAEISEINQRRGYYRKTFFGKFSENKIVYVATKFQKNFFQLIDLNFYFFANHPRERAGIAEKEKFSWLLLPIFLLGLIWQVRKRIYWNFFYFLITVLTISLFEEIDDFLYYLVPFFILTFIFGLCFVREKYVDYKKD